MTGIVYKFMPSERLTYMENELLRITQPADLNDPFEFLPAVPSVEDFVHVFDRVYKERIDQIDKRKVDKKQKSELKNQQLREYKTQVRKLKNNEEGNVKAFFVERAANNLNTHLGILSLTRRWDSTLMWAHYTNSHKGLCIGFDSKNPFFSDYRQIADKEKIFMPVTYREERIQVPIEKGVTIDFQVVLSKSKDWEYEEEERLLVMLRQANKVIPAKPFDICLYRIPHNLVKEIIVGVNFPNDKFEMVKEFCTERKIDLFKCKISETKYDMEREKYSH
jgi:hypothetical protein